MIRKATLGDVDQYLILAGQLWPEEDRFHLEKDFLEKLISADFSFIVAEENNLLIGFVEGSIRSDYVEGSCSSPALTLKEFLLSPKNARSALAQR